MFKRMLRGRINNESIIIWTGDVYKFTLVSGETIVGKFMCEKDLCILIHDSNNTEINLPYEDIIKIVKAKNN